MEQVSVFHFSGEVCPRDYFHRGFQKLWTGDEPHNGFIEFTQKLVNEYSKGKCGVDDQERMKYAIRKWKDAHDKAWRATIKEVVGRDKECPLCRDPRNFVEHAFFACEKTRDSRDKWYESQYHDISRGSILDILYDYPKLFPQSLSFVADVYKKRHKKRHSGDHSGKRRQRGNHNKRKRNHVQRLSLQVKNVTQRLAMLVAQPQRMHSQLRGERWDQNAFLNMVDGAPTVPHTRVTVATQRRAPTMQTTRYPQPQPTLMPTRLSRLHSRRHAAH